MYPPPPPKITYQQMNADHRTTIGIGGGPVALPHAIALGVWPPSPNSLIPNKITPTQGLPPLSSFPRKRESSPAT